MQVDFSLSSSKFKAVLFRKGNEDRKPIAKKVGCILCCKLYWGQCLEYAVLDYSFQCSLGNTYQPNRNIFFVSPKLGCHC